MVNARTAGHISWVQKCLPPNAKKRWLVLESTVLIYKFAQKLWLTIKTKLYLELSMSRFKHLMDMTVLVNITIFQGSILQVVTMMIVNDIIKLFN